MILLALSVGLRSCPVTRQGLELPQIHAWTKRPKISVLILCSSVRQERGYGLTARNFRIGGQPGGNFGKPPSGSEIGGKTGSSAEGGRCASGMLYHSKSATL